MKKLLYLTTTLFIFTLSIIGANAQTKTDAPQTNFLTAENSPKVENLSSFDTRIEHTKLVERKFDRKKSGADETDKAITKVFPARQQVYVRPTGEERRKRWLSDSFGTAALISSTFGAGINQIANDPPEWKRTAGGFGKRFASAYGTNAIRGTITYGLSEAFQLDNRFEKSGQKGVGKRLKHVLLGSYTTRTKTGRRIPDFPYVAGTYAASIIANEVWLPKRYNYQDGLRDGTISLGVRFGVNLLREFVFPK